MAEPQQKTHVRYPIATLPAETMVLDAYPELNDHPTLKEHGAGENDPFLRYAILMGEGTNLHRTYADFSERKREALRLAHVPTDHPRYQAAFDLTDKGVQILRWTWLQRFNSRKFRAYIALCAAYDKNCMLVESMAKDGDYSLMAPQNALLESLEHELFFGDVQMEQVATEAVLAEKPLASWEQLVMKGKS